MIALVVWLLLLFSSLTEGIEKRWLKTLTAFHAPIKIVPTPKYYSSYYYQIDALSGESGYTTKTIYDKGQTQNRDPYLPGSDEALPKNFPKDDGKDPVKTALIELERMKKEVASLFFQEYELGGALLKLNLIRPGAFGGASQTTLSQLSYLASFSEENPYLSLLQTPEEKIEKPEHGYPILLAKNFRDHGVQVGDAGSLCYGSTTATAMQEQRVPVYVSGFYDPGVLNVGNKAILAPRDVVQTINASNRSYLIDQSLSNGIQVWFPNIEEVQKIKEKLLFVFEKAEIGEYWSISDYRDYDFAKDLLQQFESDKILFTFIGLVILVIACCNIVSLLLLLVNDKKREIGILQSMGASRMNIATIFGFAGIIMGVISCLIGTVAAWQTLQHIDELLSFLSFFQGHDLLNAAFYGASLPRTLSPSALRLVIIATPLVALCAGLVPAIRAARLQPAAVLRSG